MSPSRHAVLLYPEGGNIKAVEDIIRGQEQFDGFADRHPEIRAVLPILVSKQPGPLTACDSDVHGSFRYCPDAVKTREAYIEHDEHNHSGDRCPDYFERKAPGDIFRDGLFAAVVFYDKKDQGERDEYEKSDLYRKDAVKDGIYVAGGIGCLGDKHALTQPVPVPGVRKGEKNNESECEDRQKEHYLQYQGSSFSCIK